MQLRQTPRLEQNIIITQSMIQSLHVLQMPLPELNAYIREQALSNPLIDLDSLDPPKTASFGNHDELTPANPEITFEDAAELWYAASAGEHEGELFDAYAPTGQSLAEDLHEQIASMPYLDRAEPDLRPLCDYLIDCLNSSGYLDCSLEELAEECCTTMFRMEQALFVLQSLEPPGVGARSLQECLFLQLARSNQFNIHTVGLIKNGLPLLAKNDISGISKMLGCTKAAAEEAANAIKNLSPSPARGYGKSNSAVFRIPEARIDIQNGRISIEMNRTYSLRLQSNDRIIEILRKSGTPEDLQYLKEQQTHLAQLTQHIDNRTATLERVIRIVVARQASFFCAHAPLVPFTMRELAKELELNISTVSRAIQGKSIEFNGKIFLLRDFFSIGSSGLGTENALQRALSDFIRAEDPCAPLSDEKLRLALETAGFSISRRAIAMHREKLGIPRASLRKKKS